MKKLFLLISLFGISLNLYSAVEPEKTESKEPVEIKSIWIKLGPKNTDTGSTVKVFEGDTYKTLINRVVEQEPDLFPNGTELFILGSKSYSTKNDELMNMKIDRENIRAYEQITVFPKK